MEKIDFRALALQAAKIAEDKKAENTIILDIRDLTAIANYFVITTAESTPQINAICNEIEKTFKDEGVYVVRREGISSNSWRVIDYGGLVIHVMTPSVREMYKLEKLWDGAKAVKAQIFKIKEAEKIKELTGKISKTVKKEKSKVQNKAKKASKTAEKKASTAKKAVKKKLKTVDVKVKKAKKTIKAVGKGIEAFGKTLVKKKKK